MELVSHRLAVQNEEPVLIMPIGDIQWSGLEYDVALDMLQKHIEWGVENDAWFLGMGDYIDFLSPSNRGRLKGADLYDTALAVIEAKSYELVEEIYDRALKPSRGRWLGLLEGHHYSEYRDGTTSDQQLCRLLDAPHLGTSAYVRLVLERTSANGVSSGGSGTVLIWCHHGIGGGATPGASLNRIQKKIEGFEADIYLMGHDTKIAGAPIDRLEPVFPSNGAPRLIHRTRLIAATGGFMKGYTAGSRSGQIPRGGYVEKAAMNPASLGGVLVKITPRWTEHDGSRVWNPDFRLEQ